MQGPRDLILKSMDPVIRMIGEKNVVLEIKPEKI